jgi:hypothetical protein
VASEAQELVVANGQEAGNHDEERHRLEALSVGVDVQVLGAQYPPRAACPPRLTWCHVPAPPQSVLHPETRARAGGRGAGGGEAHALVRAVPVSALVTLKSRCTCLCAPCLCQRS